MGDGPKKLKSNSQEEKGPPPKPPSKPPKGKWGNKSSGQNAPLQRNNSWGRIKKPKNGNNSIINDNKGNATPTLPQRTEGIRVFPMTGMNRRNNSNSTFRQRNKPVTKRVPHSFAKKAIQNESRFSPKSTPSRFANANRSGGGGGRTKNNDSRFSPNSTSSRFATGRSGGGRGVARVKNSESRFSPKSTPSRFANPSGRVAYGNPVMFRKKKVEEKKSTKFSGYGNPVIFRVKKKKSSPLTSNSRENSNMLRPNNNNSPKKRNGGGNGGGRVLRKQFLKNRVSHQPHSRMFSAPNAQFRRQLEGKINFNSSATNKRPSLYGGSGGGKPSLPTGRKPQHLINKMDQKNSSDENNESWKAPIKSHFHGRKQFKPRRNNSSASTYHSQRNKKPKNNPIMLESNLIRIKRVSRDVKMTKRPKSTSSIQYDNKRSKYNSLLISQSKRSEEMYTSEYLFAGNLKVKTKKKLIGKKYFDYYAVLSKDRELIFYDSKENKNQQLKYDVSNAEYECCDNLKIRISSETFEKNIKIKIPTNILFNEWVTYMSLCGMSEKQISEKKKTGVFDTFQKWESEANLNIKFFNRPYQTWSLEDVLEWLKHIRLSYEESAFDLYRVGFEDQSINGEKLKELFMDNEEDMEDSFDELSICDDLHQLIMKKEVLKLEKLNFFDVTAFMVQNKMEQMFVKRCGKVGKPFPDFLNYCKHFHRVDLLKKTIKHILTKYEQIKDGSKTYKVKFIMTENLQNWRSKQIRKFIGLPLSLANTVGLTDIKFGMFHAALAIGPLQLEWVDNSLVLIRSISSEKVLICVDIGFYEVKDIDKFAQKLAEEVLKWNREFTYDTMNFKHKKFHANCQQFVEYFVTGILNMRLEFSDDIENFLKKLKDKGNTKMVFQYNNEFAQTFNLENNVFKPETHMELDTFMVKLLQICKDFPTKYPSQWELLKGFDRAFWMKLYSDLKVQMKGSEKGKKANINDIEIDFDSHFAPLKEGCPFNMRGTTEEFNM